MWLAAERLILIPNVDDSDVTTLLDCRVLLISLQAVQTAGRILMSKGSEAKQEAHGSEKCVLTVCNNLMSSRSEHEVARRTATPFRPAIPLHHACGYILGAGRHAKHLSLSVLFSLPHPLCLPYCTILKVVNARCSVHNVCDAVSKYVTQDRVYEPHL